ncbi:MAG: diguanylate cyclase [Campylobacterota bacterium]|nr:diguanylate cyclase [Campylobacterota bacterium]
MEKILIVEDNKTLAKLIATKIEHALGYEVDVAYKLSEAKLFLKRYDYFLALLDINLPDAPNGEVVDYVLSKGCRAIVLSANIDKEFRKKILQKNIIDYVNKGGIGDVNYIIESIKRLEKNQEHKVLVVDDSMVFRKTMKDMLENLFFNVVTVAHGEEALGILEVHLDTSLVITDYNMPVMNGLELTYEIRKKYNKSQLCILAISSNNDEQINAMFLKSGANDYINKPFSKEEFSCRVNNSIEALENIQFITNHANRDFLTGLYNRRYFFKNMSEYMQDTQESGEKFAMAMVNIDFFKKIDDRYGADIGEQIIISLSEILRTHLSYSDLVSRFDAEEFCLVLKNISKEEAVDVFETLRDKVQNYIFTTAKDEEIRFTISIGATMNSFDTLEETMDHADMLLYNIKQGGGNMLVFD